MSQVRLSIEYLNQLMSADQHPRMDLALFITLGDVYLRRQRLAGALVVPGDQVAAGAGQTQPQREERRGQDGADVEPHGD